MGNLCFSSVSIPKIFTTDISKVERFTYSGQYKYCVFDHIYDGDTADIYFIDKSTIVRAPFRFYGYDSAEIKPLKSEANRDNIIREAKQDREYLSSLIRGKYLIVEFMENEKYGRMMGNVYKCSDISVPEHLLSTHPEITENNCVNKIMIKDNHGKIYYGGRKN